MAQEVRFEEPGFSKCLFASTDSAWIWLIVRLYLGYEWAPRATRRSSRITG